jgi:hypothetical protein
LMKEVVQNQWTIEKISKNQQLLREHEEWKLLFTILVMILLAKLWK